MAQIRKPEFTVDTGLFRQLGELLVGRDSTALVELVKNSYDADATSVIIQGHNLDSLNSAVITITDDGTGMTEAQLRAGFLRLAARGKTEGERRTPLYRRRFTGEKGVGRLAAHKLAALLDITTVAPVNSSGRAFVQWARAESPNLDPDDLRHQIARTDRTLMMAQIDWDLIEAFDTISEINSGLLLESGEADRTTRMGTTLSLSRLRHEWTNVDIRDVVRQLNNFEPPSSLISPIPRSILQEPLLFARPVVRDTQRNDPGITVQFEGDFSDPEEHWGSVIRSVEWVLEIRAQRGRDIQYSIAPTKVGIASNEFAMPIAASRPHPSPDQGPFFDARILLRPGQSPTIESSWTEFNSGIRVYLEGFRILPYGEPRNDWLSLDFAYTKRGGRFELDPLLGGAEDGLESLRNLATRDVSLRLLPNRNFFGAIFLTEAGAGGLRTLVNREGFVPDESHERLVELVTTGLRLLQRSHALASFRLKRHAQSTSTGKTNRSTAQSSNSDTDDDTDPDADDGGASNTPSDAPDGESYDSDDAREWAVLGHGNSPRGSAARLQAAIVGLQEVLGSPLELEYQGEDAVASTITVDASQLQAAMLTLEESAGRLTEDVSLLRLLASVGSQLAAFTHELSFLVPTATAAEDSLSPIRGSHWPPEAIAARRAVTELRRALERQASYLVDVASAEGRRRRSRQPLRKRVDAAFLGLQGASSSRSVELVNDVPDNVRTPPMFRAELQAVLSNLLTNAVKAAGSPGVVEVNGNQIPEGVRMVAQNTGIAVEPGDGERWFVPYESTSTNVDLTLGQGMGLGLPITRDLISEYGGSVRFVRPTKGFSTAVEVVIPQ